MAAPATYPGVLRARIRRCRCPAALPDIVEEGSGMRAFGLDVHRDFCEVAIGEQGVVRSAGRIATRVESLELFAQSLIATDVVASGGDPGCGQDRVAA